MNCIECVAREDTLTESRWVLSTSQHLRWHLCDWHYQDWKRNNRVKPEMTVEIIDERRQEVIL